MPAPWAKLVFAGNGCTWASLHSDISAYAPLTVPPTYTRSPSFTLLTPAPTASTTPPVSPPGVYGSFGPRLSVLDLRYVSTGFTPAAWLRTSTCPCPGCGAGISSSFSTFGPPYSDTRIAFIAVRSSLALSGLHAKLTLPWRPSRRKFTNGWATSAGRPGRRFHPDDPRSTPGIRRPGRA